MTTAASAVWRPMRPELRDDRLHRDTGEPCDGAGNGACSMTTPLSVADVLERAADLIEPEGAWTQGGARNARGFLTWGSDPEAKSFCALAAIARVAGPAGWREPVAGQARDALRETVGLRWDQLLGDHWNDAPERTQADVVASLREGAAKARGES